MQIRERSVTSRAVVEAYIERVREVNPYVNAIVKDRFEEALREADLADARIARGDDLRGVPFHGVPCTIKARGPNARARARADGCLGLNRPHLTHATAATFLHRRA